MPRRAKGPAEPFDPTKDKPKLRFRLMVNGSSIHETTGIGAMRHFVKQLTAEYSVMAEKPDGSWKVIKI